MPSDVTCLLNAMEAGDSNAAEEGWSWVEEIDPEDLIFIKSNGALAIVGYLGSGTEVIIPEKHEGLDFNLAGTMTFGTKLVQTNSVTRIEANAFARLASPTSVTIPDSVTTIADSAFYSCDNLETVILGSGVTSIGNAAFKACTNLKSVYFEGDAPGSVGGDLFAGSGNPTVYYAQGSTGWAQTFAGRPTAVWTR